MLNEIDLSMLTFDSIMCGLTVFVVWSIMLSGRALHTNLKNYEFGSDKWWNYVEHIVIILIALVGALGLSFSQIMHTFEQNYNRVYCDYWEIPIGISNMILLVAILLLVKHVVNEAKRDSKVEQKPKV